MKYIEILAENRKLKAAFAEQKPYKTKIVSNVIVTQLKEIYEYYLMTEGIHADISVGDYDNILQDSASCNEYQSVIIFWELANLIEGLQYKAEVMSKEEIDELISQTELQLSLVFKNLTACPLVIMNKFTGMAFSYTLLKCSMFENIAQHLNIFLEKNMPGNFFLVDTSKVFCELSIDRSIDFRNYYSSKSLYTIDFYKQYSNYTTPVILSILGKSKKALILDCDNTLWKGVVGEDGMEGIQMSAGSKNGVPFEEIQYLAKSLSKKGIILGLCSKNNAEDIDEVLQNHKDMSLTDDDLVIKKVNWADKASNLSEIASELNIGIDTLVFVDDSDFELNLVKSSIPQIKTIKVPENNYLYPAEIRKNLNRFFNISESGEDIARVKMYKQELNRENKKSEFTNIEDYLSSLELKVILFNKELSQLSRLAQMTQKTNQFNLTTKRYTENDIKNFLDSDSHILVSFEILDKFGSYGITGMVILNIDYSNFTASVDSFLMSCRILGRNIEKIFWDRIFDLLKSKGISNVNASFIPTSKNMQTEHFYEGLGFNVTSVENNVKNYSIATSDYTPLNINYIKVEYGK